MFKPSSGGGGITNLTASQLVGKNYLSTYNNNIGNGDFELGLTTGFALGNVTLTSGIPTGVPTFGSGSSGNLSIAIINTLQLSGLFSMSYVSSAATVAGDFVASNAFTIDSEDQAKVLTFKMYYKAQSGGANANWSGTVSNSFGVAIWDVTNSAWVIPAGVFGMTQSSGAGYVTGTFQTASNASQYRFVMYNVSATSGAVTLYLDDISVGPQTAPLGVPASDPVPYTPVFGAGFGTVSSPLVKWARLANMLFVSGTFPAGTTGAGVYTISLPNGLSVDTSKISIGNTSANPGQNVGFWTASGTTGGNGSIVTATGTSATVVYFGGGTGGTATNTPSSGAGLVTNAASIGFWFQVPIAGWSSNVQMSNDTDTRVIAMQVTQASPTATITSTSSLLKYSATPTQDTHGAFNTTSGSYVAPASGYYRVIAAVSATGTFTTGQGFNLSIAKNGTVIQTGVAVSSGAATITLFPSIATTIFCNAGDTLAPFISSPGSALSINASALTNYFDVERVSGPSVIAATESVNATYNNTSGQSFATATILTVTNWTKVKDTHNAFNAAAGTYTIPVTGSYRASLQTAFTPSSASTGAVQSSIVQSGSAATTAFSSTPFGGVGFALVSPVTLTFNCVAGDVLSFKSSQYNGGTLTLSTNATFNTLSIERVGN